MANNLVPRYQLYVPIFGGSTDVGPGTVSPNVSVWGDLVGSISDQTDLQAALDGKATVAQAALADTAVQPGTLAGVATSGAYADLTGKPTLGTAAATDSTAYATAAQGTLAGTAVQPADLATVATTGSYNDLSSKPTSLAPTSHAASHLSGGSDSIKLDDLSVPDDNTDLDATTSRHGLLPKLGGGTTNYLRADGSWATPATGGGSTDIAAEIVAATGKTTPVNADVLGLIDTVESPILKKLTWANIKDTLKTYFDALYQVVLVSGTNIKTVNGNSLLGAGDLSVSASAAGSTGQIQYNNAGVLAGNAGLTYNGSALGCANIGKTGLNADLGFTQFTSQASGDSVIAELRALNKSDVDTGRAGIGFIAGNAADGGSLIGMYIEPGEVGVSGHKKISLDLNTSVAEIQVTFGVTQYALLHTGDFGSVAGKVCEGNDPRLSKAPNVQTVVSAATVTPTFSNNVVKVTAQAQALTIANPSGSVVDGWRTLFRIKDDGTPRAISYGSQYRAIDVTLPTTTVAGKTLYLELVFNSEDTKVDVVAVKQQA